jgi:hypothetical protein
MTWARRGASRCAVSAWLISFALAGCGSVTPSAIPSDEDGGASSDGGAAPATDGGSDAGNSASASGGGAGPSSSGAGSVPPLSTNGGASAGAAAEGGAADGPAVLSAIYATRIESFEPGPGAGYHQDELPDVVLGPPQGKGPEAGSLDVLSLGAGGSIVLSFGEHAMVDGPGADFVVFENAFWPGGDASVVFAELGEVSVSQDGDTWYTFACDEAGDGQGRFPGCAGVTPTLVYDADAGGPLDPTQTGGDPFDLAAVGLSSARYVRIVDLETLPQASNTTGFDLDAVGIVHAR